MEIIYPMFALVLLTFTVGLSLGASRFISVTKRQVNPDYYKLLSGHTPPEYVAKLGRNFSNLLEVPILFYVVGILVVTLDVNSSLIINLAWLFVGVRLVHSIIHVTYNHPVHRFFAFLTSSLIVLAMWIELMLLISK